MARSASTIRRCSCDTVGALWFDGIDDSVTGTNPFTVDTALTVSAWINMRSYGASSVIVVAGYGGSNKSVYIAVQSSGAGSIVYAGLDSGSVVNTTYRPPIGKWAHVALARAAGSSKSKVYINGALSATAALAATFAPDAYPSTHIGRYGTLLPFPGMIYDVRIYSRELSSDELLSMSRLQSVSSTNLVRHWPLTSISDGKTPELILGTTDTVSGAVLNTANRLGTARSASAARTASGARTVVP